MRRFPLVPVVAAVVALAQFAGDPVRAAGPAGGEVQTITPPPPTPPPEDQSGTRQGGPAGGVPGPTGQIRTETQTAPPPQTGRYRAPGYPVPWAPPTQGACPGYQPPGSCTGYTPPRICIDIPGGGYPPPPACTQPKPPGWPYYPPGQPGQPGTPPGGYYPPGQPGTPPGPGAPACPCPTPGTVYVPPGSTPEGWCCAPNGEVLMAPAAACTQAEGAFFGDRRQALRYCARQPAGWCCAQNEVFSASARDCLRIQGAFFGAHEPAAAYCGRPTDIIDAGPLPTGGWCCAQGEVFSAPGADCRKASGIPAGSEEEAAEICEKPPEDTGQTQTPAAPTANAWCCANGTVYEAPPQQCLERGWTVFADKTEAEQACQIKPPGQKKPGSIL